MTQSVPVRGHLLEQFSVGRDGGGRLALFFQPQS